MTSRKFLVRELKKNIKLGTNKCFKFNDFAIYRDGELGYKILDEDGEDFGTYHVDEITEMFIKMNMPNKKPKDNKQKIKTKPRKKKRFDVILPEFMGFIKEQPCMVDGCDRENVEAHHVYGRQPARHDNVCVPLCSYHHRGSEFSVHEGNVKDFRKKYTRKNMQKLALSYFKEWVSQNEKDNDFYKDLVYFLEDNEDRHSAAIKEFILGRKSSNKKS
jgi:hypothetical protein